MGLIWFWVPTKYPKPSFKVLENHGRPLAVTPNPWMNTLKVKGNIHIMGLQWFWVAVNYPEPSFRVLENQVRPLAVTPNPWVNAVPRLQRTWFRVALFEPQPELRVPTSHLRLAAGPGFKPSLLQLLTCQSLHLQAAAAPLFLLKQLDMTYLKPS